MRLLLLIALLLSLSLLQQGVWAQTVRVPSVEKVFAQPEDAIDLGVATLSLAQEFYPDLNPAIFLYTLDYLARRYKHYFGYLKDPDERLRALNTFLYRKGYWNDSLIFSYDTKDLHAQKRDNRFINGYIASRKGSCVTMPMLYLILAERLRMPMYGVRAPNHFFVRYYPDGATLNWKANVEATSGGGYSSDTEYAVDMNIPKRGIESGMYLRTLRKKEYLASLLLLNVAEHLKVKNLGKAEHYAKLAFSHDSTLATAVWALGLVHRERALALEAKMQEEIADERRVHQIISHSPQTAPVPSPVSSLPAPEASIDPGRAFRSSTAALLPELQDSRNPAHRVSHSQHTSNSTWMPTGTEADFSPEAQITQERYFTQIQEEYNQYEQCMGQAKAMGMAFGPQTTFLKKQTQHLKAIQRKGDK